MSDEAAFLEALRANPADDTTRLVYADWLDERDRPHEAEYLRLTVACVSACHERTAEQPEVRRLRELSELLQVSWRNGAAGRFKVTFYGCLDSAKKLQTIKAIREITGLVLAEVAAIVELPPKEILDHVPFEQALGACLTIREASENPVLLHPYELTEYPLQVVYRITAKRYISRHAPDKDTAERESMAAFAAYLVNALDVSGNEANELVKQPMVTLIPHVEARDLHARYWPLFHLLPRSRVLGPDGKAKPDWSISLDSHMIVLPS